MAKSFAPLAFAGLLLLAGGVAQAQAQCKTVYDIISDPARPFSSIKTLVDQAGLASLLSNTALTNTVFLPSNRAVFLTASALLSPGTNVDVAALPGSVKALILSAHVVPGVALNSTVLAASNGVVLSTLLATTSLTVNVAPGLITLQPTGRSTAQAPAVSADNIDIAACGGSIAHSIDFVIVPASLTPAASSPPPSPSPSPSPPPAGVNYGPWPSIFDSLNNIPELSAIKDLLFSQAWFINASTATPPINWATASATFYFPTNNALSAFLRNPAGYCPGFATKALDPLRLARQHVILGYRFLSFQVYPGLTTLALSGDQISVSSKDPYQVKGAGNITPANVINANLYAGLPTLNIIDQVLCY